MSRTARNPAGPHAAGVLALVVITTAQLMLVLDDSIANIALPTIQRELTVDPILLPWVVNAYILSFGSLLLFGGRLGDALGRRRVLRTGLVLFVIGSLAAALAPNIGLLIAGRAVQGIGAALTAPNSLAMISTTFCERANRDKAISLYGAMSGLGVVLGLVLGGLLTGSVGWRWVFMINAPLGIAVLLGTGTLVGAKPKRGRLELPAALLATAGSAAIVFAITEAGEQGATNFRVTLAIALGIVLLVLFVLTQRKSTAPLLPLTLLRDRARSGGYIVMLLLSVGPMGSFYILTLYLQQVREFSPILTGVAWLPFAVGLVVGSALAPRAVQRVQPRFVAAAAALLSAAALLFLGTITPSSSYWLHLGPAMLIVGVGFALSFVPLTLSVLHDVPDTQSGVASALLNTAQQLGVAFGIAVLAAVAAGVTRADATATGAALTDGFAAALTTAAGVMVLAAVVAVATLRRSAHMRAS